MSVTEWQRLVTASKVAAILGVSPWESPRSVWHMMRGDLPTEPQTEVQSRGHYLEPAILAWWRDRHSEHAEWRDQPTYTLGSWAAATPDGSALCGTVGEADWHRVLVEAKSTSSLDDWGEPGTDEIPTYYLVQAWWQMHVSGVHRCYVPIIGPSLRFAEYVVDYDPAIGADLEARMRAFYDSLAADEPPPLDDTVATYAAMRKVHPLIDRGETVELAEDVAAELVTAALDLDAAEARDRFARSTVLGAMGRAQYATCNGTRVARRQPNGDGAAMVRVARTLDFLTDQEMTA